MSIGRVALVLVVWPLAGWCQKPAISKVVNAASYGAASGAGGSIVSIFGTNLAICTQSAQALPLPGQICGTSVSFGGIAAPLFYVSPTQINLQEPVNWDGTPAVCANAGSVSGDFVVCTAAGQSEPYTPNGSNWLGIFSLDASGCGPGAVLNVAPDGSVSLNSPANSVPPGGYISVFGTGLNANAEVYNAPPDGSPAPFSPLAKSGTATGALWDFVQCGDNCPTLFSGLAPGLVGVGQFNFELPATVREGCAVPLQILGDSISQPITVSIGQGGGHCIDPPTAGYGQITWEKTVISHAPPGITETDAVSLSLQASPGKQAPPTPTFTEGVGTQLYAYFGPSCPIPGYRSLGAGTITVQGPQLAPLTAAATGVEQEQAMSGMVGSGATFVLGTPGLNVIPPEAGQVSGLSVYQATLPSGTIKPGTFTVTASGGTDVGSFQSSVQIGSGIQITFDPAGSVLQGGVPFTIYWTGGDSNEWINVYLISHATGGTAAVDYALRWQVRASEGQFTIPQNGGLSGNYELVLEVVPDSSTASAFSASGLSLGGQATWRYVYRFEGLLAFSY